MNKMKVAVVGYGHIGKQHCMSIKENDNLELAYICDPFISAEDLPDEVQETSWVKDYNTFIESNPEIDLLIIATPNHLHYPMLEKAMTTYPFAGTPILAEKPIVLHDNEIKNIHNIQEKRINEGKLEIPLFINYPLRFLPSVMKLKEEWEMIGNIRMVNTGVFWNRNQGYYDASDWRGTLKEEGGPLFNEFIHHLDLMSYLCGDMKINGGMVKDFEHDYTEVEDSGIINLIFQTGGFGVITYTVAAPNKSFDVNFHFMGDKGSAKLTGLYNNQLYINDANYSFDINREHYGSVLEAIREKIENNIEDERLCYWREGMITVGLINTYYRNVRSRKVIKGEINHSILTDYNRG